MIRVAIIGAGSVEFTRNVVADLCSYPELAGQITIALHDIDAERLAYAERAAGSIVRRTTTRVVYPAVVPAGMTLFHAPSVVSSVVDV